MRERYECQESKHLSENYIKYIDISMEQCRICNMQAGAYQMKFAPLRRVINIQVKLGSDIGYTKRDAKTEVLCKICKLKNKYSCKYLSQARYTKGIYI